MDKEQDRKEGEARERRQDEDRKRRRDADDTASSIAMGAVLAGVAASMGGD